MRLSMISELLLCVASINSAPPHTPSGDHNGGLRQLRRPQQFVLHWRPLLGLMILVNLALLYHRASACPPCFQSNHSIGFAFHPAFARICQCANIKKHNDFLISTVFSTFPSTLLRPRPRYCPYLFVRHHQQRLPAHGCVFPVPSIRLRPPPHLRTCCYAQGIEETGTSQRG